MEPSQTGDYAEIGTLLRQAREEMNLTLDQAARRLNMRVRYLQALEEGRFTELPGVAYMKGYLRSYAGFLRLDKREMIRRFEQIEGAIAKRGFYLPDVLNREKTPNAYLIWGGCAGALVLYLFWWAVLKPERLEVSLVEPLPQPLPVILAIPGEGLDDVACLRPWEVLYPPCHVSGAMRLFDVMPPSGQPEAIRAQAQAAKAAARERRLKWLQQQAEEKARENEAKNDE